ncbi:phytoene desaturase family protein [Terribacillus saccharophilus]|uniref:phytoene desaturase family protein n=1 Tax=Terribacillus saccharophilus TaxID=361277 RepID=UPI003982BF3E
MTKKKVAIIGAGPGGLTAGMLLAAKGYNVEIFEKNDVIGGRTSRLKQGEFQFDLGATFFMMPQLLEELFEEAGRDLNNYVQLHRLDPLYTLRFGDVTFTPRVDRQEMLDEIERVFPGESEGFIQFMDKEGEKFDRVEKLLRRPFVHRRTYMSKEVLHALPKLDMFQTVYSKLSTYFNDERLKYAFTFQAKYLGMSPWKCPGTFTILSYLEHKFGLYHPIGGVNRICEAMRQVIEEYGGMVHTGKSVAQVLTEGKQATGLRLEDGREIPADEVIINADYSYSMQHLFEDKWKKKFQKKMGNKKYSCSTFMLYLGLKQEVDLPHHMVVFADDYKKNVEEMTEQFVLSDDPSVYIHYPTKLDPTTAPAGKSTVYLLMPVPNTESDIDWEEASPRMRQKMLDILARETGIEDIEALIETEHCITPTDWEAMNIQHGAVFNLAHSLDQMMYNRPHNQVKEISHCYLVGGGTHPGSGLPTIFQSAKISADLVEKNNGVKTYRTIRSSRKKVTT